MSFSHRPRFFTYFCTLIPLITILTIQQNCSAQLCNLEQEDINLFIKDATTGLPTPLRNNTPYAIKNLGTGHVFAHHSRDIQLLKLSHWWELRPESHPNIYKLQNIDPNIHNKMPFLTRTLQIRRIGRDIYSLHPTSCGSDGKVANILGNSHPTWIYYDYIDGHGKDQVDCEPYKVPLYNSHTKLDEKYQYSFTSVGQHLSTKELAVEETIVSISSDPDQPPLNLIESPPQHSNLLRTAIINNCGSGEVEQEVSFGTKVTVLSRLRVENSYGILTNSRIRTKVHASAGGKIAGLVDFGVGVTKSWSREKVDDSFFHNENTFGHEQSVEIKTREKIRVGNHSCVKVDAKSAFLEDFQLFVKLDVKLQLLAGNNNTNDTSASSWDKDSANKVLQLVKFSGKNFTYIDDTRTITYSKKGKVELNSMMSMETNVQQVVCDETCVKMVKN